MTTKTTTNFAGEVCRWVRRHDGTAYRLDTAGQFQYRPGPSARWRLKRSGVGLAWALRFMARLPGYEKRWGPFADEERARIRLKVIGAKRTTERQRPTRRDAHLRTLTPEQQAEVEARIEAHRERVQRELARLERGRRQSSSWRRRGRRG